MQLDVPAVSANATLMSSLNIPNPILFETYFCAVRDGDVLECVLKQGLLINAAHAFSAHTWMNATVVYLTKDPI